MALPKDILSLAHFPNVTRGLSPCVPERYFDREPLPVRWHIDAKPPVQLELF